MKKLIFALFLFLFSVSVHAQEKKVLSILMKDGSQTYFLLKEKPSLTFTESDVVIVSASNEATVKRSLVDRFEFIAELPAGIDGVEEGTVRENVELTGDAVCINGLEAGCKVQLFSLDGRAVLSAVAGECGCVTISLAPLPSGVYLVNYNETTIKFMKL